MLQKAIAEVLTAADGVEREREQEEKRKEKREKEREKKSAEPHAPSGPQKAGSGQLMTGWRIKGRETHERAGERRRRQQREDGFEWLLEDGSLPAPRCLLLLLLLVLLCCGGYGWF